MNSAFNLRQGKLVGEAYISKEYNDLTIFGAYGNDIRILKRV
jgi:hypothetical protein